MSNSDTGSLSSVPNGRIIDFEEAEVRTLSFQDGAHLWVKGKLPNSNFDASLAPRIYHDRPDYWGIEVAVTKLPTPANDAGTAADASLDFERSIPLSGITGIQGVAVIGASRIKRIEISGGSF